AIPSIVPTLVVVLSGWVAARSWPYLAVGSRRLAPLGYGNAAAALFALGFVAALMLASSSSQQAVRVFGWLSAAAFALAIVRTQCLAASILLALPLSALVLPQGPEVLAIAWDRDRARAADHLND